MSSLWHPPKEDSPSVLSNRVFSTRRLNKIESQRLGLQLNNLDAEVSQTTSLISQEQKALRKELDQIREVKGNPGVSMERRKLLQEVSSKESQMCRHRSTLETQGAHKQQPHLLSPTTRQRSLSTNCPPLHLGGEKLTWSLNHKVSGNLQNVNSNKSYQEVSNDMYSSGNRKQRQRSLSTGTYPRISAWLGNKNEDTIRAKFRSDLSAHTEVKSWQNRGMCQDHVNLELRHSLKSTSEETKTNMRQYGMNKNEKLLPEIKMQSCSGTFLCVSDSGRPSKGVVKDGLSKLTSTRKVRSYSTNSAPTISEGRVVCLGDKKTTSVAKLNDDIGASQGRMYQYRASSTPNVAEGVVSDYQKAERNKEIQRSTVLLTRRNRSLSTNCPRVISLLEENDEKRLDSKTNTKKQRKVSTGKRAEQVFQQI